MAVYLALENHFKDPAFESNQSLDRVMISAGSLGPITVACFTLASRALKRLKGATSEQG